MAMRIDRFELLPAALVLALVAGVFAMILRLNDGQFVYSLDDPYIHLAMAEGIARLHYGINPGEASAASSSALWPFLLAPFAALGIEEWVPLLINAACAVIATFVLQRVVAFAAVPDSVPHAVIHRIVLTVALALGLDLVGLVFTGMEHSLQVLCAMLVAYGLMRDATEARLVWWLPVAIVAGPLLRYESLALSLGAIGYLACRGRWRLAIGLAGAVALPLAGFSLFLHQQDLGWLPTSVLVKLGAEPQSPGVAGTLIAASLASIHDFPRRPADIGLAAIGLLFVAGIVRAPRVAAGRSLSVVGLLVVVAHLVFGQTWRFPRYEVYAEAAAMLLLVHRYGPLIGGLFRRAPVWVGSVATVVAAVILFPINLVATIETPLAANNIFEQQFQMHRAAGEIADGPVAVNDLGWASYRNDRYVLDLWGLASKEAWRLRRVRAPGWMRDLAAARGVELAMIYDSWLGAQVPADWVLLGRLRLGRSRITPASDLVSFYATSAAAAARLRPRLSAFAAGLPAAVRLERATELPHEPAPAAPVS